MARFEIIDGRCVIPHGVTEILEEEFADCQELKEVVIPDTVVNIGMGAFMECHSLQSVTIPRSVTKIPHCAFFWCTSLKEVFIPDSVKVIGPQAFEGCAKLRSVTIPEGVECKKQVFDQQFSEKLDSADFGKQVLHLLIDKAVMRKRASASRLGA